MGIRPLRISAEKEGKVKLALAAAGGPLCKFSLAQAHPRLTQACLSSNRIIDPPPVLLPTSCLSLCAVSKVTWRSTRRVAKYLSCAMKRCHHSSSRRCPVPSDVQTSGCHVRDRLVGKHSTLFPSQVLQPIKTFSDIRSNGSLFYGFKGQLNL